MSGIAVFITTPAQSSTVGRKALFAGSISPFKGAVNFVRIQLGAGGPVVSANHSGFGWGWQGLLPNNVRPGQAFQIVVTAIGTMVVGHDPEGDPITQSVDGEVAGSFVLENIVPELHIQPFRSPIVVAQLPYLFTLEGSVSEAKPDVYGVPKLQCQIGSFPVDSPPTPGHFSVQHALQPGSYPITVQASDPFASVTTIQTTVTVLGFQRPAPDPSVTKKTLRDIPTTSSMTSWTRLEPLCAEADIGAASSARLFDPLWIFTRQWQIGEFQAEDTGTPVKARARATNAPLTRCHFGEPTGPGATQAYDRTRAPLEALVERRRMRPVDANDTRMLALAVDAGLQFLRMLEIDATGKKYRPAFLAKYAMQPLPPQPPPNVDDAAQRFVQTMAGRAPDARLLALAFQGAPIVFDPSLNIAGGDIAAVQQVATAWMAWYAGLFAESAGPENDAWVPSRLEYAVSVAARFSTQPQDALTLSASEFDGGRLDWNSFDVNPSFPIDTSIDQAFAALDESTVPSPVHFRGAPAPRFWEMEDAKIAYGLVPVGPTDLAHLLMIEYASTYGNDWFVLPLKVPVGSITRIDSLVVTDSFGVRSLLRPIGDPALPAPCFSMWQLSRMRAASDPPSSPVPNAFFLPPAMGRSIDGGPLEDVLFMRDEMSNLAWAIERSIEGATELPMNLTEGGAAAPAQAPGTPPAYLISSAVPKNWVPLLPVQLDNQGTMRLKRGAVLQPDGTRKVQLARSEALRALGTQLLFDEEIPREGVHITRRRRLVRWMDGSTWVWTAFRNDVGRGEGSAGLRFDPIEDGT